jgi:hypothetical protein
MIDLRNFQMRNMWFEGQGKTEFPFFKDSDTFANFVRKHKDRLLQEGAICRTSFGILVNPEKITSSISAIVQETNKGR